MFYSISPSRKAVLIGCPGNSDNFLKGVEKDLHNVRRFLASEKGGLWHNEEIVTLDNPSLYQAQKVLNASVADYTFVYFSGHGYTDTATKQRMLSLRDYHVADTLFLNGSPRQLIMIDACRNFVTTGLAGTIDFESDISHFEGSPARELFDRHVLCSPEGKVIIHSTRQGYYSYDSPHGGMFTNALLTVSTKMRAEKLYSPVAVSDILSRVPLFLQGQNNNQVPAIVYSEGSLSVPFAFTTTLIRDRKVSIKQAASTQNQNAGLILLGIGLLVFGAAVVASN